MFNDRIDAGRRLGVALERFRGDDPVVVGLPRGGVSVAAEVADALGAPLDVLLVRKLGVPQQPELAMGAIGEGGVVVVHHETVELAGVSPGELAAVERSERVELERRAAAYRPDRPLALDGRTVIVVDDGFATGATARAACAVARRRGAARVVLAVPVAPEGWTERAGDDAHELVALETPSRFVAVGRFYDDFTATTDQEVVDALRRRPGPSTGCTRTQRTV